MAESQEPSSVESTVSQAADGSSVPGTTAPSPSKKSKSDWISPVLLCILLLVLISASRVYIGGPEGVIFVWKGEFSFNDTIVNIAEYANLPQKELTSQQAKHPHVISQMEEMDLLNPSFERPIKRKRIRKNSDSEETTQSTP